MAFKMKGFSPFQHKKKNDKDHDKEYGVGHKATTLAAHEDLVDKFLKEQHEERVKRSDFEEGSIQMKMFDCNQDPKTKWNNKTKKCEPIKKD